MKIVNDPIRESDILYLAPGKQLTFHAVGLGADDFVRFELVELSEAPPQPDSFCCAVAPHIEIAGLQPLNCADGRAMRLTQLLPAGRMDGPQGIYFRVVVEAAGSSIVQVFASDTDAGDCDRCICDYPCEITEWVGTGDFRCEGTKYQQRERSNCDTYRWTDVRNIKWEDTGETRCDDSLGKVLKQQVNDCGVLRWVESKNIDYAYDGHGFCIGDDYHMVRVNDCGVKSNVLVEANAVYETGETRCNKTAHRVEVKRVNRCGVISWRQTEEICGYCADYALPGGGFGFTDPASMPPGAVRAIEACDGEGPDVYLMAEPTLNGVGVPYATKPVRDGEGNVLGYAVNKSDCAPEQGYIDECHDCSTPEEPAALEGLFLLPKGVSPESNWDAGGNTAVIPWQSIVYGAVPYTDIVELDLVIRTSETIPAGTTVTIRGGYVYVESLYEGLHVAHVGALDEGCVEEDAFECFTEDPHMVPELVDVVEDGYVNNSLEGPYAISGDVVQILAQDLPPGEHTIGVVSYGGYQDAGSVTFYAEIGTLESNFVRAESKPQGKIWVLGEHQDKEYLGVISANGGSAGAKVVVDLATALPTGAYLVVRQGRSEGPDGEVRVLELEGPTTYVADIVSRDHEGGVPAGVTFKDVVYVLPEGLPAGETVIPATVTVTGTVFDGELYVPGVYINATRDAQGGDLFPVQSNFAEVTGRQATRRLHLLPDGVTPEDNWDEGGGVARMPWPYKVVPGAEVPANGFANLNLYIDNNGGTIPQGAFVFFSVGAFAGSGGTSEATIASKRYESGSTVPDDIMDVAGYGVRPSELDIDYEFDPVSTSFEYYSASPMMAQVVTIGGWAPGRTVAPMHIQGVSYFAGYYTVYAVVFVDGELWGRSNDLLVVETQNHVTP